MNIKEMFGTDKTAETAGIELDYGDFWIKIARAGGSNKRYLKILERVSKPYRRAIERKLLSDEKANEILKEVYAQCVVLGWGGPGLVGDDDQTLPYSQENCRYLFDKYPDLFTDIKEQAESFTNFKLEAVEAESKN